MVKLEEGSEVVDAPGRVPKAMSEEVDSTGGGGLKTVTAEELFGNPSERGSPGGGESKTMTSEEFSGRPSERGSPGGGVSNTVTAEELFVCRVLGGNFWSAMAMDSHMRVHSKGKETCVEGKSGEISPRRDLDAVSLTLSNGEELFYCQFCRKTFPSKKSLYGHMRIHPERPWRGGHPSTEDHIPAQAVTGKCRSKIDLSFFAKSHPRHLQLSLTVSDEEVPVSGGNTDAGVKIEVEMPREENLRLDVPRIKAQEAVCKNPFKRKAGETSVGDIPDPASAKKYYSCKCGKSFSKFQSLGGHTSSCKVSKQSASIPTTNQPTLPMLTLSLAPPNTSRSNLGGAAVPNPGCRTTGFDLNVDVTLSSEEYDRIDGTEPDQDPPELGDMTSS